MKIVVGELQHIPGCLEIAGKIALRDETSELQGFLLSGGSEEAYADFFRTALVRVALLDEVVAGFLIVLRPESKRFFELIIELSAVEWQSKLELTQPNLLYIEKIAVRPELHGRGIAL